MEVLGGRFISLTNETFPIYNKKMVSLWCILVKKTKVITFFATNNSRQCAKGKKGHAKEKKFITLLVAL
jgi:hypothetical protein